MPIRTTMPNRSRLVAVTALFGALGVWPAQATHDRGSPTVTLTQTAPLPCLAICAHWETPNALGYDVCAKPFPPGAYDETTLRITGSGVVSVQTQPVDDYDSFICSDTEPRVLIAQLGNLLAEVCSGGTLGPFMASMGCRESGDITLAIIRAATGDPTADRFVLVSYNWLDAAALPVVMWGPVEIIDDSFEASVL